MGRQTCKTTSFFAATLLAVIFRAPGTARLLAKGEGSWLPVSAQNKLPEFLAAEIVPYSAAATIKRLFSVKSLHPHSPGLSELRPSPQRAGRAQSRLAGEGGQGGPGKWETHSCAAAIPAGLACAPWFFLSQATGELGVWGCVSGRFLNDLVTMRNLGNSGFLSSRRN